LKLLAEGEEALSDDEEVEVVAERDDADPVVLALDAGVETEPDEDDIDDPDVDAELVVVTVAPMVIGPLVSIAELILLIWTASTS